VGSVNRSDRPVLPVPDEGTSTATAIVLQRLQLGTTESMKELGSTFYLLVVRLFRRWCGPITC
jgi:hypothetical protein